MCIEIAEYHTVTAKEWCRDNEDVIDERNNCTSDVECFAIGRKICNVYPDCFGVSWYENNLAQPLRICRSNVMEPKTDGWRTIMKLGTYTTLL